jgi:hypothetical protein
MGSGTGPTTEDWERELADDSEHGAAPMELEEELKE